MSRTQERYPGTRPFNTAEQSLFFGRDDDAAKLSNLILLERTVIFYGKSGLGKSSLIQARIVPYFQKEKQFDCNVIRFFAYHIGRTIDLVEIAKQTILSNKGMSLRENADKDLITILRQIGQETNQHQFLFVFEQAEEIFEYPVKEIERLAQLMNDLIYLPDHQIGIPIPKENQLLDVRILFSIRADRISSLDSLSVYIPNILKYTFELRPLDKIQAFDAIVTPALYARNDFKFKCPRFHYNDGALDKILLFLTKGGKGSIEAFQLQIICSYLEKKIIADPKEFYNDDNQIEVQLRHVDNLQEIYENYYANLLFSLAQGEDLLEVRRMIEEGLIFKERRLTMDGEVLTSSYSVKHEYFDSLVEAHLLRKELNSSGGYSYEIAHDAFILPILKARDERKHQENIDILIQEKEKKYLELQKETEEAFKKRSQILIIAIVMGVFSLVVFLLSLDLAKKEKKALVLIDQLRKQKEEADSLKLVAQNQYQQLIITQANEHIRQAEIYLKLIYPKKYYNKALEELSKAYDIYPSKNLQRRIDSVRTLIRE